MVARAGRFVLAAALVTTMAAAVTAGAQDTSVPERPEHPNLSGRWRFDRARSEDAEEKVGEALESVRSDTERSAMREALAPLFDVPEEMTITHTEAEIVVLEKDGRMRALHPDGRDRANRAGEAKGQPSVTVRRLYDAEPVEPTPH
jgi:Ni/Co efflux regulator RcnB